MNEPVPVTKNDTEQMPIPTIWRRTFIAIASAFQDGHFRIHDDIPGVCPVPEKTAKAIAANIENYGARLTSLPEETWQTSACQWMDDYWEVLVDLFTVEEGASDLAISARVYESGDGYSFEVRSVHVP